MDITAFAAVWIALFTAHSVGDHWVQSSWQSLNKGRGDRTGRIACALHVASLTLTKALLLLPVVLLPGVTVNLAGLVLGLGLDAATHYWADRRTTLARFAGACGKGEFYQLGGPAHEDHPVSAGGGYAPTIGTGAYALDQSFHHFWLFVAALVIAAV